MFFKPSLYRHPDYWQGVRDLASVATGIGAWGLMTGVAMIKSGMSTFEAVAMTLLVFAGSAQLAAIPLIASGAPLWVILATAFCVNLRFVVFSAHLRPYVMHLPLRERLVTGYLTADLSYVFFARRYPHAPHADTPPSELVAQQAYLMGNCGINWMAWMGASLVGIALANGHPHPLGAGVCRHPGADGGDAVAGHLAAARGGGGHIGRSGGGGLGLAAQAQHRGGHRGGGGVLPADRPPPTGERPWVKPMPSPC